MRPEVGPDGELNLQLTRVYVALTLSRNVVTQLVEKNPTDKTALSLNTLLAVTSQMLEGMLDPTRRPRPQAPEEIVELNHLM